MAVYMQKQMTEKVFRFLIEVVEKSQSPKLTIAAMSAMREVAAKVRATEGTKKLKDKQETKRFLDIEDSTKANF